MKKSSYIVKHIIYIKEDQSISDMVKDINFLDIDDSSKDMALYEGTAISLPFNIVPTILSVSINGEKTEEYILEDHILKFNKILKKHDKVMLDLNIKDTSIIHLVHSRGKSLYKEITPKSKFKPNSDYFLEIHSDIITINKEFQTEYEPMYSDIEKVRMMTGELLINIDDDTIAKLIYDNSCVVKKAIDDSEEFGEETDEIPQYVYDYVKYKTALDLCYAMYLSITGKLGSESKTLRNITVEKSIKLPYINDMLSEIRKALTPLESILFGSKIQIGYFVKGGNTPYPLNNLRRSF